jgi:hypothetical protein
MGELEVPSIDYDDNTKIPMFWEVQVKMLNYYYVNKK